MTPKERRQFWKDYTPDKRDRIIFGGMKCEIVAMRHLDGTMTLKAPMGHSTNVSCEFVDPRHLVHDGKA